jgi:CRISPR-associated protein Cas8b/Csh1 subtype I-B
MQLPDAEEFTDMYDDEKLLAEFPDHPITSLRDIQYVYGKLYTLATVGGGEYAPYLTPDQATDLLDEGDSLIVVRADLSDDEPRLDLDEPIQVKNYKRELIPKVAHSYYDSARGFDHSVTHRSGRDKESEKLAEYAQNRLSRWAPDEVIHSAAEGHEDGWIIEKLAELGEDEEVLETIEREVTRQIDGTATSLLTVQVKLDDDGEYLYPGDVEVFNEAMKQRLLSKLVSKGEAKDSRGVAVDMVSDQEGTTVGTSEDPLNYYLGKQMEKFPGFDPDEAWRTHPVSEDSALNVNNADPFVDACTYTTFGATVYYLPYLIGKPDAQGLRDLYALLRAIVDEDDMTPVEAAYDKYKRGELEKMENVRFYVTAVMKHQQKRFDVYGETMDGRLYHPVDLARAHQNLLDTWAFDETKTDGRVSAAFGVPPETEDDEDDSWRLLRRRGETTDFVSVIASGWYFRSTFPSPDDDQDASADDARIHALVSVLSGDGIEVGELLKVYADRLTEESGDSFPRFTVASQYAQMCALAKANLLKSKKESREPITQPPEYENGYMTTPTALADGGTKAAARERKLAQFLEQTPALDDDERRGAFLLGALVGQVGGVQSAEGRGRTVVDQYPVKSMTKTKLKRTTEEVLDKNLVYSRERNQSSTMYAEVVDRLRDTLLQKDIEDWEIRTEDLRFYYALGVTYGMNSYVSDEETDNEEN